MPTASTGVPPRRRRSCGRGSDRLDRGRESGWLDPAASPPLRTGSAIHYPEDRNGGRVQPVMIADPGAESTGRCRRRGSSPPSPCCACRGPGREGALSCGSPQPVVTAPARRRPAVPDAARTQHGPGQPGARLAPVPSGRGRLRRSGPPRPGTDRPAGHGKADASLDPLHAIDHRAPEIMRQLERRLTAELETVSCSRMSSR
jgi:hypothetical protein